MFTKVRLRFDIKRDILLLLYRGGPKEIAFRQDEKWGIQMNNNIMICGENPELQLFLQTCILHDEHLKCFWFQINETPTAQVVSLVESSAFADNFVLEATAHPNWAELQLLLLGTPPKDYVEAKRKNAQRRWIQLVINQAMANGFRGKICVVLPHDHLWVYSALRFSGLPANNVFGLGTMGFSETVARLLGERLDIGSDPIYANVIGTQDEAFIAWSRAQIAGNSVLGIVAQDNSLFGQANLDEITKDYQAKALQANKVVTVLCLQRICRALFFNHPILVPLTHEIEFAKQKIAISEPVVLSKQGVAVLTKLALSEEEMTQYIKVKQNVLAELENLRKQ